MIETFQEVLVYQEASPGVIIIGVVVGLLLGGVCFFALAYFIYKAFKDRKKKRSNMEFEEDDEDKR